MLLLGACGPGPHLAIDLCSDLLIPDEVDSVRLLVQHPGEAETVGGYLDLLDPLREPDDPCPAIMHEFPVSFMLVEGRGDMLVEGEGLLDGVVRVRSHARAEFPPRGAEPVTLVLARACIGVSCAKGQTCRNGRCELIPRGDSASCIPSTPPLTEEERCPEEEEEEEEEDDE